MAFAHAQLPEQDLGAAGKFVGAEASAKMQMMAARGLAPLPPRELVIALYQLWAKGDGKLSEEAARTLEQLPANVLDGALAGDLPPGALDFIARKLAKKDAVLERVLAHDATADETLISVARVCTDTMCEQLAHNQQRWLTCPKIVESLYSNPNCKMSTAHRMVELAVREGLDLDLPNIEEIKLALGDGAPVEPERDDLFRRVAAPDAERQEQLLERLAESDPEDPEFETQAGPDEPGSDEDFEALFGLTADDDLELPLADVPEAEGDDKGKVVIAQLRPMEKVRLALLGNTFERSMLIRDSNKSVCMSAIKSPRVKENEVVGYAANRSLSPDVIRYISRKREWTKLYAVKLNLVLNPKTPMPAALGFLGHLHAHDVRKIANSKNIPSALATAAKRRLAQRS